MTVSFYLGILQLAIGEDVKYSARREAALLAVASMEFKESRSRVSEGAETESRFNASMIKGAKVAFRPGIDLKEMLATLKYEKVK